MFKNFILTRILGRKKSISFESLPTDEPEDSNVPHKDESTTTGTKKLSKRLTVVSIVKGTTYGVSEQDFNANFGSSDDISRVISEIKKSYSTTVVELKASIKELLKELLTFFCVFVYYIVFGMFLFFYIEECSATSTPKDGTVWDDHDIKIYPQYSHLDEKCEYMYRTLQKVAADTPVMWNLYEQPFLYYCSNIVSDAAVPVVFIKKYDRTVCHFDEFMLLKYAEFTIFTLLTIGYGTIAPATNFGRIVCIFYAAFGIPLAVSMYSIAGKLIMQVISLGIRMLEFKLWGSAEDKALNVKVIIVSTLCLVIVMAIGCSHTTDEEVENLNAMSSIYFWFVTLTTIGFGDISFERNKHLAHPYLLPFAAVIILFGLGLIASVIEALSSILESGDFNAIVIEEDEEEDEEDSDDESYYTDSEPEEPMNDKEPEEPMNDKEDTQHPKGFDHDT